MKHADLDHAYQSLQEDLVEFFGNDGKIAVVKAPPGSGKTHTLIEVLAELAALGSRIAVAAQTNSQADDIAARLSTTYPDVANTRFVSQAHRVPADALPQTVWTSVTAELPEGPGITIATTAKWSLTNIIVPYDLLAIDESWQMSWADLMQCALLSGAFLMIGDPGQIPPVVTIDVRRWETSPRAPHIAAPDVVLTEPALAGVRLEGSLPACRRLPYEAVEFIKPFYDFDFCPYVNEGERSIRLPGEHQLAALGDGRPLLLTVPTPEQGPPPEVDVEVATAVAEAVDDLITAGALIADGNTTRRLAADDIGISSSHRIMNAALQNAVAVVSHEVKVDTPERWQGLERPMMIVVHPLSGSVAPSAFDLETGRLCVMASRHQCGLIIVSRDHVGQTLADIVPAAEQAPGRPDVVGRGHDAHLRFWEALRQHGRIIPAM